jgi:hypothetical protein
LELDFTKESKFGFNSLVSVVISFVSAGIVNAYIQINFANTFDGGRWTNFFDFDISRVVLAFIGISVWLPLYGLGLLLVSFALLCLHSSWKILKFRVIWLILLIASTYLAATGMGLHSLPTPALSGYLIGQIISTIAFVLVSQLLRLRK